MFNKLFSYVLLSVFETQKLINGKWWCWWGVVVALRFGVQISLGESENISKLINRVIHKVRTLRGGRGGPAKSVLIRMGERRRLISKRTYTIFFFIDSQQNRTNTCAIQTAAIIHLHLPRLKLENLSVRTLTVTSTWEIYFKETR